MRFRFLVVFALIAALFSGGIQSASAAERDPSWRTGGDSRACSAPIWSDKDPRNGPGAGRRVLIVGDSNTRNTRQMLTKSLRASGWNPTIRCFGGKRIDWGMAQVKDQRQWKGLPDTIVIALGTNDMRWINRSITQQRIKQMLELIGPQKNVVWINTYGLNGDRFSKAKQSWFNKTLDSIAAKYPRVQVLPWAKIAKSSGVKFSGPLHYAHSGNKLRTAETVRFLNDLYGQPVQTRSSSSIFEQHAES